MADECGICRPDRAPSPGGVIHDDRISRVEHIAPPIPLLGWLVVAPARHVTTFADSPTASQRTSVRSRSA